MKPLPDLFAFPLAQRLRMIADFHKQMEEGLAGRPSLLKMLPTCMSLPTGRETGTALAIDMGGTNLRVMLVRLAGKPEVLFMRKRPLSRQEMSRDAHTLFAIVAEEVNRLLTEADAVPGPLPVGFTFSYPVQMESRSSGKIVALAKELTASGLIGEDPFVLLARELAAYPACAGLTPRALLNDTVTELIYAAYLKKVDNSPYPCRIGGIIGTGNNFAMLLPVEKLIAARGLACTEDQMIVNLESGNFTAPSLPRNVFDEEVDAASLNPGFQHLEKTISGNYLGRIAAAAIRALTRDNELFGGDRQAAKRCAGLDSPRLSEFEAAFPADPGRAGQVLAGMGIARFCAADLAKIYEIVSQVTSRAARIAATNAAALVLCLDPHLEDKHTVAIDGSVFGKHHAYRERMCSALEELYGAQAVRINLEYIPDGSGIGAAIAALHLPPD